MQSKNLLTFAAVLMALCVSTIYAQKNSVIEAVAVMSAGSGSTVKGNVTFTQNGCGENVHVHVYLTGVNPGKHGFHVHEKGSLLQGCASMGGHYNPDKMHHGGPSDEIRHAGDLGNIEAGVDGNVFTTFTDNVISLNGKNSILGRGLVLHEMIDDLGQGEHPDSKKTGNAGGRLACGVIGIKEFQSLDTPKIEPTFYVPQHTYHAEHHPSSILYPILAPSVPYPYVYSYHY